MGVRQAPQQEHIKRKRWMQNTHSTIEKQLVPIILQRQAQGQRLTPREKQLLRKHSHIFKPSPGVGPIAEKYILQQKFRNAFANNPQG